VGYFDSYNSEGVFNYFNSVTTDPEGNKYYVGIWNAHYNYTSAGNNATPLVVKVNAQGQVEWKSRLTNTYTFGSYGVQGEGTAIGYDPRSGNIVVVAVDSGEGNSDQMLVIDVNTQNGDVVTSKRLRNTGDNDIEPHGLAINTQGERFITGRSQGSNYISFSVNNTMVDPDHHDTLMIPKSVFAGHDAPSLLTNVGDWYIDGVSYMDEVDYYTGITGTVRQGSGASFDVTADGVGGYTVALNQAGVNYRAGHRVLITGDNLGGTTPTNDATVIVDSINSEATGDIATVSIQGISTGSGSYTALTGSNKDVGSGFTIDVQVNSSTGNLVVYYNAGGTNYVDLDQITFPGTSLGGTNPTTNLVIKALDVGMSLGDVQPVEDVGYEVVTRGTSPLTYVRCKFQGNPNLSTGGPWNLYHYTDNNSFLVKLQSPQDYDGSTSAITWAKFIDKQDSDRGVAVDYDSDGNIYWASLCIDEDAVGSDTNYKGRPTVTKLNSSGATQWIKSYDWDGNEGFVTGLQVDSEDKVVISWQNWFGGGYVWRPVIQRMLPNGDKLWGKKIYLDGTEGYTGGLALDSDDNIYVTSTRYNGADEVLWTARLDIQSSDIIWQQDVTREGDDMYLGWYNFTNTIAVDDNKYYLAGLTFDLYGNEGNAIGIALPTDGSAAGNTVGSSPTTGPFAIDEQFYNTEGGGNSPVTRNYTVANWTELVEVNNREPIQAWIETGPTFNYPVYTTSDAGIKFSDGTVQTTSASGLPQVRHNRYSKEFKLKLSDAGRHIYIRNSEQAIIIPTYSEVPFEVGSVITIVNLSGGSLYLKVTPEHQFRTRIYSPQLDGYEGSSPYGYYGYQFQDYNGGNYITLMKLEESYSNGSVWMVTNQGGNVSYW
jgi:hypothetical protein